MKRNKDGFRSRKRAKAQRAPKSAKELAEATRRPERPGVDLAGARERQIPDDEHIKRQSAKKYAEKLIAQKEWLRIFWAADKLDRIELLMHKTGKPRAEAALICHAWAENRKIRRRLARTRIRADAQARDVNH